MTDTKHLRKMASASNDGYLCGPALAAADAIDAMAERIAALEAALLRIADDDYPRPAAEVYRSDGANSKHDKCKHGCWMYEDCGGCAADFARAALGGA